MSSAWERGAGFRIIGFVERKFVPPSGRCAFVTVSVPGKSKDQKLELVTFDKIEDVGSLAIGATVQLRGHIGITTPKTKARDDVTVDGRSLWIPQLIVTDVAVQESKPASTKTTWGDDSPAPTQPAPSTPHHDDDWG